MGAPYGIVGSFNIRRGIPVHEDSTPYFRKRVMIIVHTTRNQRLEGTEGLSTAARAEVVWIDLVAPDPQEVRAVEAYIGSELMTRSDAAEIESTSRFYEDHAEMQLNANFLKPAMDGGWDAQPVSFALRDGILVTRRDTQLKSFTEMERRRRSNTQGIGPASEIFLNIFEVRIDLDADITEQMGREIVVLSKYLKVDSVVGKDLLIRIDELLDRAMLLRENIVDKQRSLAAVLKSERFPTAHRHAIRLLLRDIDSLLEHLTFGFERLEFLQNTAMGLVNIDQNKVIKIFTVATVVFMPPTLIASIYGMNFDVMPELQWTGGYPFALALMLVSSGITLYYFKRKGWL